MTVNDWNNLPAHQARRYLMQCCHVPQWLTRMIEGRPYSSFVDLKLAADTHWLNMCSADLLEAFTDAKTPEKPDRFSRHVPRTGTAVSRQPNAHSNAKTELIEAIQRYEQVFGFHFVICEAGKTTREVLKILLSRMHNPRDRELQITATEQIKIIQLRLPQLFHPEVS